MACASDSLFSLRNVFPGNKHTVPGTVGLKPRQLLALLFAIMGPIAKGNASDGVYS